MKPKAPHTTKEQPSVSIHRPEAVVTVVIGGQTHKLTEAEATTLHAQLANALNIQPQVVYKDRFLSPQPAQWDKYIPTKPAHISYVPLDPLKPYCLDVGTHNSLIR